MKYNICICIGIDPDTAKSGVAIKQNGKIEGTTMSFFDLYETLQNLKGHDVLVRVSAGWLNKKTNFRQKIKVGGRWVEPPPGVREKMSEKTGRNHQVGMLIAEACKHLSLEYELVKPYEKKWTPEIFKAATGIDTKNQEIIDAGVLVIGF